ncbi:MAG: murein biosynthesis integral membrane protein MurJ [Erysipelotrichaceae bacterium]|nr:murein biosynthesis integral membrane protein MurJ [Erysipelotrichaceae bacterium]
MTQTKKVAKSAIIIMVIGLLIRPLAFFKEMLIGAKFGLGMHTDTYILATSTIELFILLLNKAISTTFIPILHEVESKEGKAGKIRHTNNLLNIIIVLATLIILIDFIIAPWIVKITAPGFNTEPQFSLAVLLIRIGLPAIIFSSVQGVLIGYLQTEGRFIEGAAIGMPMNIVFIIFLVFLSQKFGIIGLMVTSVVASIFQVLYLLYGTKKTGFKYSFYLNIHDAYIKKVIVLIPPVIISVGISDLNTLINKAIGSTLVEGSISALNYADKLTSLVNHIFISAITTVMYPIFAKEAVNENKDELKKSLNQSINIILLITIPATIVLIVLSHPIVKIVYERGVFDSLATSMTASALVYYAIRLTTMAITIIVNNIFYSLQDTKTPLYIGGLSVLTSIIFSLILIGSMKHNGLALAATISSFVSATALLYTLHKKIGRLGLNKTLIVGLKALFATGIMGIILLISFNFLLSILGSSSIMSIISLFGSLLIGIIVYTIIIYFLKIDEFKWIINSLKQKIKK